MAWNDRESETQLTNPLEGSLGKFIPIIVSVVALAVSQSHPPVWFTLVLAAVIVVSAVMMVRSPFTATINWIRERLRRRRAKAMYMTRLVRLSAMLARLLESNNSRSFYSMLMNVITTGRPSPYANMTETQEFQALNSWNQALQSGIRYSTVESFESIIHGHDALIHHYIFFARNSRTRLYLVLADAEVPPQNKEAIRRNWDECRNYSNELINSWREFRADYEASLGRSDDIYYEVVAAL